MAANNPTSNRYTKAYLRTLTTPSLLAYYKAERRRFNKSLGDLTPWSSNLSEESKDWANYLAAIKSILDKREHVPENKRRNSYKTKLRFPTKFVKP